MDVTIEGPSTGKIVAWERGGVKSKINGQGLESKIFTINVGSEGRTFSMHEAYLCQSPVFERMCHGDFKESQTSQIFLPDDDPATIGKILQYLYAGDFDSFLAPPLCTSPLLGCAVDGPVISRSSMDAMAHVYIAAEKYGLQDLKILVVEKIGRMANAENFPVQFLDLTKKIYSGIPGSSEDPYCTFTREEAAYLFMPNHMQGAVREKYNECIAEGGALANDLVAALCSKVGGSDVRKQNQIAELEKKKLQIEEDLTKSKAALDHRM
ncbi:MAG: hypothetical protein Q9218_004678 [Villophora microphyllina]